MNTKEILKDLKGCKTVDFITNYDEILRLKSNKRFEDIWLKFRSKGGDPDDAGVIVGHSKQGEVFLLMNKMDVEKLGELLNKRVKEMNSEERAYLMDDTSTKTIDPLK